MLFLNAVKYEFQISSVGQLYVTGGSNTASADRDDDDSDSADDDGGNGRAYKLFAGLSDVDVVDVDSDAITHAPPMRIARSGHATAASATSLFVFGGRNTTGSLSSCEEFNTQTMR